jgi:hypothetical protein
MNFDQLPKDSALAALPMRARLAPTGVSVPSVSCAAWELQHQWVSTEEEPLLCGTALRLVKLESVVCLTVKSRAIAPRKMRRGKDERAFVYLLNPADPVVWTTVDSWLRAGCMSVRTSPRRRHGTSVSTPDLAVTEARDLEGEELHSDMLAGAIEQLLERGELEAELAKHLDIKVPLYCAIVETPLMLKSLQHVDMEEWRLHKEHEMNRWLNEDIAS